MKRWNSIHNVVVVGLGMTGLSVVRFLNQRHPDVSVKVIDTRETPPGMNDFPQEIPLHTGSWNQSWLMAADLVVLSPGIALATPEIQQIMAQKIPVVGDIELFAWEVDAPVIAITGSNGKSTVTDLTGVLAKGAGLNVAVGGNIGLPALDLLNDEVELYVLELSSFQLETTSSLHLVAAAFLNLSEDHMDRYADMAAYRQAKLRIFDHAQYKVVNREDRQTYPDAEEGELVSFGLDDGLFGVSRCEGGDYLVADGHPIMPVNELQLVGQHNIANVLTVLALLSCSGIDYVKSVPLLKSYQGLTHRCQVVAEKNGIKWVNDSKATNVASTLAALSGLEVEGKLHLLVGGVGKGADFSTLAPALASLNVALHCFGRDGDQFMSLHPSARHWDNMEQIIRNIQPELNSGDIVMLSPACASFDQFKNFMARGDYFTQLASEYA